jgi:hypothetical protein
MELPGRHAGALAAELHGRLYLLAPSKDSRQVLEMWDFDGTSWRLLSTPERPSFRENASWVRWGGKLVLFGGKRSPSYPPQPLNETWEWDGTTWTQRTPPTSPPPRYGQVMAEAQGKLVLFGGQADESTFLSDTWEWDGTTWTQRFPLTSPPARSYGSMGTVGTHALLFGGLNAPINGTALGDTWRWDGDEWTPLTLSPSPSARSFQGSTTVNGQAWIVGGRSHSPSGLPLLSDVWRFDGTAWVQLTAAQGPSPRRAPAVAGLGGSLVVLGGAVRGAAPEEPSADIFLFDGTSWLEHPSSGPNFIGEAVNHQGRFTLFTPGHPSSGPPAEVWWSDGASWESMASPSTPVLDGSAIAVDPSTGHVLLFGGIGTSTYLAETWEWNGTSWRKLNPATSPPARIGHAMATFNGTLVLFGGMEANTHYLDDTWVWNGTTWAQLSLTTRPLARRGAGLAQVGNRLILFGGARSSGLPLGDTWAFDGSAWTQLTPVFSPPPMRGVAMTSLSGKALLFGGDPAPSYHSPKQSDQTWEFDGTQWVNVTPASRPSPRFASQLVSLGDRAILYEGAWTFSGSTRPLDDVWTYRVTPAVEDTDAAPPTVVLTGPTPGATLTGTVTLTAVANDNVGVAAMDFLVDETLIGSDDSAPYSVSWSSRSVPNGNHSLTARARDAAGNAGSSAPVTVKTNNSLTPPVVSLTSPSPGVRVNGTVQLSASASASQVSIARVEFYDGDRLLGSDSSAPYGFSWNTELEAPGDHSLTARAHDTSDNVGYSAPVVVNVWRDSSPPAVSITAPGSGATLAGTVVISAAATDETAVSRLEFFLDGQWLGSSTSPPYGFSWNTRTVANGGHTLLARATDSLGNTGTSAEVLVTVDNEGPTVALTSPASGALLSGRVSLQADATDSAGIARVDFLVDGVLIGGDTTAPFGLDWDSGPEVNGTHTLTARAYDTLNNVASSAQVTVLVDNTGPVAELSAPVRNAQVSGTVLIRATVSDPAGVDRVEFYVDGASLHTDTREPYEVSWDSSASGAGPHTLAVKAFDSLGNPGSLASVEVLVDNTAPVTALVSPAPSARLRGTVSVSATASDNQQVSKVEFYAGGNLIGTDTTTPYEVLWDTAAGPGGNVTLTTKAHDAAGNVSVSAARTVTVDNAAPIVAITSPANGTSFSFLTFSTTIQASASDNMGVTQVVFYDGATVIGTDTTAPYSFSWSLSGVPKGTHTLTARAHDAAGNVTTSAPISVRVN